MRHVALKCSLQGLLNVFQREATLSCRPGTILYNCVQLTLCTVYGIFMFNFLLEVYDMKEIGEGGKNRKVGRVVLNIEFITIESVS